MNQQFYDGSYLCYNLPPPHYIMVPRLYPSVPVYYQHYQLPAMPQQQQRVNNGYQKIYSTQNIPNTHNITQDAYESEKEEEEYEDFRSFDDPSFDSNDPVHLAFLERSNWKPPKIPHNWNDPGHDKEKCMECRRLYIYLLSLPTTQDLNPNGIENCYSEYSLFGPQNLKLFDNPKVQKLIEIGNVGFNFARFERFSTGLRKNSSDESYMIGSIDIGDGFTPQNDPETDAESECGEHELSGFAPLGNSTGIGKDKETPVKSKESYHNYQPPTPLKTDPSPFKANCTSTPIKSEDARPWKQPKVFDPSLSQPYNDAFPSLNKNAKIQEKKVLHRGNGRGVAPPLSYEGFMLCVFCRNNGEPVEVYMRHAFKDVTGRVVCPVLRKYRCIYCNAYGDYAHTRNYCPIKFKVQLQQQAIRGAVQYYQHNSKKTRNANLKVLT